MKTSSLKHFLLMLMLVMGVTEAWGQSLVEITTSAEVTAGTQKLYLIQSYSNEAFYMRNNSRNSANALNTSNIVTTNSEFYFMDGDVIEGTQYYYIVHKETGNKYVYMDGTTAKYGAAPAADATDEVKNTYRFKIVKNGSRDAYNIIPINQTNSLNKKNGNSDGADVQLSGVNDDKSCWNFVAKGNYTKPSVPFIPFTANGTKAYYYLQNNKYTDYYLISGANPATDKVTTGTKTGANEQNMMWYLKKAPASENDYYIDYYYIVHVETGKYLYLYQNNTENADNAVDLKDYDSSEDNRFLYIVVRGAVSGETHDSYSPTFCIAPQALKTKRVENTISLCRRTDSDGGKYNNAGVFKERGNNNFTHWNFEIAKIICAPPVFTEENGSITLSCETDDSEIYYTDNGDDPTADGVTPTKYNNQSLSSSSQHRIKAYAKLEDDNTDDSNSDVATLLNKPDVTLAGDSYTYKGTAWEPAVTVVSIGSGESITIAPTSPATYEVASTDYTNNINVSTDENKAKVTVRDVEGDAWYIWHASKEFDISPKAVTITAASDSKNFDGTPLTAAGFTATALEEGDTHVFTVVMTPSSTITDVGTQPNVIATVDGTAVSTGVETAVGNYLVTTADGTLEITVKSIGNGTISSGYTLEFGENGAIILKDGETTLTEGADYTISGTTSASGRYSNRRISGINSYTGYFIIRNANVNFQTDANEVEWSGTFVAEPVGADEVPPVAADNTKGHALPDGVRAYIITSIEGNWAIPEELNYIPEGIPVLLVSDRESGGFLVQDASGQTEITTTQISKNMLEVRDAIWESIPAKTIYLLYKNEFVYNMPGDLAVGKVYLNPNHTTPFPAPASARLRIKWDTETGIDNSQSTIHNTQWYTLDGRCLNGKPTLKGLYLHNGRKEIVR